MGNVQALGFYSFERHVNMPRLDHATRNIAIGRIEDEEYHTSIVHRLNVNQSTISRLMARFQQYEATNDRPRFSRPRVTTATQDRYIRLVHLRDRTVTTEETTVNVPEIRIISAQTVRNRLRQFGLRAKRHYFGHVLRRHHRQQWVVGSITFRSGTLDIGGEYGSVMNLDFFYKDGMDEFVCITCKRTFCSKLGTSSRHIWRRKRHDVGSNLLCESCNSYSYARQPGGCTLQGRNSPTMSPRH